VRIDGRAVASLSLPEIAILLDWAFHKDVLQRYCL
jgi:hypothetical protein